MDINLKRALLIDYLSDLSSAFSFFMRKNSDEIFNKKKLNLSMRELKEQVIFLERGGYISFEDDGVIKSLTEDQLTGETVLSLTLKGGNEWENLFKPDWHKYIQCISCYDDENEGYTITSISRGRIEAFKKYLDFLPINKYECRVINNWNPFYWKHFKEAYQIYIESSEPVSQILIGLTFRNWRIEWQCLSDAKNLTKESKKITLR